LWPALPIGTSLLAVCSPQSANRSQPSSASYPKADRGHRMDSTADARASR
jgi:hypothetical protein